MTAPARRQQSGQAPKESAARPAVAIRTAINGLGHMGMRGLQALQLVAQQRRRLGDDLSVRALLDVDRSVPEKLQSLVANIHPAPRMILMDRSEAIDPGRLLRDPEHSGQAPVTYFVYDASPNRYHFQNLKSVLAIPGALYLGEKPMISNCAELAELERAYGASEESRRDFDRRVFCDLIETQSEVCLHLADLVASGDLEIDGLRFFRLSSSGIAKACGTDERGGVEGGAFVDKGIHDIAITLALLGSSLSASGAVRIESARPLCFLPRTEGARTGLLDGANRIWSGVRSANAWPADGAAVVETEWSCGARTVPVTYNASWIGVRGFDDLNRQHFPAEPGVHGVAAVHAGCPAWLFRRTAAPGLLAEDARLLEIAGRFKGVRTVLLANFLCAPKAGIAPWIWDRFRSSLLPIPERKFGANSLARVFERILFDRVGASPCGVDFPSALRAHQVLWNAHRRLIPDRIDEAAERIRGENVVRGCRRRPA